MSVIYEVSVEVDPSIRSVYQEWLAGHVREVVSSGGFEEARVYLSESSTFVVHYVARSQSIVDDYLKNHAPRLRADGIARFGEKARASRRILTLLRA